MRLICPNCDAEYEVDGDQISSEGRDVQCSNCAHTWLQMPEGFDDTSPQDPPDATDEPQDDTSPPSASDVADEPQDEIAPPAPAAAIKRHATDPDALNVLLEEVELEMRQREAEVSSIETQTELGLDQADFAPAPVAVPDTVKAEATPEQEVDAADFAPAEMRSDGNKRQLLPDIEEINSTLSSAPARDDDDVIEDEIRAGGRRGFRTGFGLMLLLAAFILMFYAYAPQLAENFPQFKGLITSAVGIIDALRAGLETAAQNLLQLLNSALEGFGN